MTERIIVGYDAKRIVRNATGLGSYGRTLVNDLSQSQPSLQLRLYAPDQGRDDLRRQICEHENIRFCYPAKSSLPFSKALWRTRGIISDLQRDGVQIYHGLTGELPIGIRKSGIKSVVTIHDLIFLRHPEYYHWLDTKIYAWKFRQTVLEAESSPSANVQNATSWPTATSTKAAFLSSTRVVALPTSQENRHTVTLPATSSASAASSSGRTSFWR